MMGKMMDNFQLQPSTVLWQRIHIPAASTTRHHRAGYPNGMPAQITSADDSFIFNRRRGSHALNAW